MDNETWVIETGEEIIQKKSRSGIENLTPWETLVYCLWVADYGMRNAGDLDTAFNLYPTFQTDGYLNAKALALPITQNTFALAKLEFEKQYFGRFEAVCDEIKSAKSPV